MQLPASVTMGQAAAVHQQVRAALAAAPAGQAFELDAGAMASFDTSALALMLDVSRAAQARGLAVTVVHAPPKLRQLAEMYGVADLLKLSSA